MSTPIKVKPATVNDTADGMPICKKFNDARGCTGNRTCPMGKAHVCDVLLLTGTVCGSKNIQGLSTTHPHMPALNCEATLVSAAAVISIRKPLAQRKDAL